ncbi:hypothetical protein [Azospirillum largimobile]
MAFACQKSRRGRSSRTAAHHQNVAIVIGAVRHHRLRGLCRSPGCSALGCSIPDTRFRQCDQEVMSSFLPDPVAGIPGTKARHALYPGHTQNDISAASRYQHLLFKYAATELLRIDCTPSTHCSWISAIALGKAQLA